MLDWTLVNTDPLAFQNDHNDKTVGMRYSNELDSWVFGGPNTVWECDSKADARQSLITFICTTRRPSGMV
ncbi:hypothetical protein GCM10022627_37680 [Haloarcula argentinensis]